MNTIITQTKIVVPSRRSELLSRQRLTDYLYDSLMDKKITIIAAPAGYGKTSLAVDLAFQIDLPICWYALDSLDQDLQRFITYFIASIAHRFPKFGEQSSVALKSTRQNEFNLDRFITIIVNEIYSDVREHFAVVLDDYHLVDNHQEITEFINRFAQAVGENCHLLILSRTLLSLADLPLMIARSLVGGLDYKELAFKPEEIQAMVLQNHHLTLPDMEAEAMAEETEGWITGLLLSTQTMWQGMSERIRAARVSGIGLYDYLAQQVLDQQPPSIREFLLHTSLLEEFDSELCKDVFGAEHDWNELIAITLHENLFILPVDTGRNWVRYHHLFRDFLQTQLAQEQPDEPVRILRRFAAVLIQRKDWDRAHEIYQRLNDMEATADLIVKARPHLMRGGRWRTLAEWIDTLPEDILTSRPGLVSAQGIVAVMLGDIEQGLGLLNKAVLTLQEIGNTFDLAYTLERRAYTHRFLGNYQAALSDVEQALSLTGQDGKLRVVKAEAMKVKAHCWKHLGQLDTSLNALLEAKEILTGLDNQDDLAIINTDLGAIYRALGSFDQAKSAYQTAINHLRKTGNIINLAFILNNAAVVYHTTGDYEQTVVLLEESLILSRQSGYKRAEAYALSSLGDVYTDLDAPVAARRAYQNARQVAELIQHHFLLLYLNLAEASLLRSDGELPLANELLQSARMISQESNSTYERALFNLGAGQLALSEKNALRAQTHLQDAVSLFENGSQWVEATRASLYLALAYFAEGDLKIALRQLEYAFQSASKLKSQHILVVTGREAKSLLEAAQEHPTFGLQTTQLLQQITRFEADIPSLRRRLRQKISTEPFAPPHLTIQAFGEGQVLLNGKPASDPDWVSRKPVRELLFCLLAHPKGLTKEEIGLIFWPESSPAKLKLRFKNLVYWLRHALRQDVVLFEENSYHFNRSLDYEYDAESFTNKLDQAREAKDPDERIAAFREALHLYQGSYLQFTDQNWVVLEREHLRLAFVEAGLSLGQLLLEAQDYLSVLETCKRLLAEDPCLEAVHRLAMRAHAAIGNRAAVARQFETCGSILKQQLDVSPSEETEQLYEILMR